MNDEADYHSMLINFYLADCVKNKREFAWT